MRLLINSIVLGVGLAMDAFSVSLADGLKENNMKFHRILSISGLFALFQFMMPLIGYLFLSYLSKQFLLIQNAIPYISLLLLVYIGFNLIKEGIINDQCLNVKDLSISTLIMQAVATSIDALSVGFTTASYQLYEAFLSSIIIGIVTYIICFIGIVIGKKFGVKCAHYASIVGGVLLMSIGVEIFVKGVWM